MAPILVLRHLTIELSSHNMLTFHIVLLKAEGSTLHKP